MATARRNKPIPWLDESQTRLNCCNWSHAINQSAIARSEVSQMGELFKVCWDLFTIRHYSRQGMKLSAGDYLVAFGAVLFLYATGVGAAVFYQNHPKYEWVLVATMVVDAIVFIALFVYEIKWWIKHRAAARAAQLSAQTNQSGR
jgi:hypothetical protein